jgi:Zn-dependent alcohol dehydrogenase
MSTRARVVIARGDFGVAAIQEVQLPDPGPHQVLLLIYAAGVGHSQLHVLLGAHDEPVLLGAEAFARVMAVGSAVDRVKPGDMVVVSPAARPGASGDPETITVELEDGSHTAPSACFTWATNAVVDERFVYPGPPAKDREACAILGETALAGAGAVLSAGVSAGHSVAVLGASGAGLAAIAAAKAGGASVIVAIDRNEARLALATQAGATFVSSAGPAQLAAVISEPCPEGVRFLFDCAYDYRAKIRPGATLLATEGKAFLVATPGNETERSALASTVLQRGYAPSFSLDPDRVLAALASWVESGAFAPSPAVVRYTIEAVNEATRDLENGDAPGQPVLVMEPLE